MEYQDEQARRVHLILLIHGLYGSPANLAVVKEEVIRASRSGSNSRSGFSGDGAGNVEDRGVVDDSDVVVLVATSFKGSHTWDGIDVNAHRASVEVDQEIERLRGEGRVVDRLSIMGYSLGGLVGRYLAGLLAARTGFFDKIRPVSFSTAATPHLGVLKYGSTLNTVVHTVGRRLFSRSGQQLYCLDKDEAWGGRALLQVMADPDCVFLHALTRFEHIVIVANGCHDLTVPYPTATFSLSDPFEGYDAAGIHVDADENNILRSWHQPDEANQGTRTRRADVPPRPFFPPFLYLRWPFTYLLIFLIPVILPLWLCFVFSIMTLHTFQSRRRHRQHTLSRSSTPDSSATPLLGAASLSHARVDALRAQTSTSSLATAGSSGASTPTLKSGSLSPITVEATTTDDVPPRKGQVALLLTPGQKVMARNLQSHLQHAERIIGWFPWAYNAHAVLVARDVRRFQKHEEGRGVVREWATRVVDAGRR